MRKRINPFILAHGTAAGPLMRPGLTGFLSGLISSTLTMIVLYRFDVSEKVGVRYGAIQTFLGYLIFGAAAGFLYGVVYQRAANDTRGGWIFGASAGFVFWMINPVVWWPWLESQSILVGPTALMFMISHILFGCLLGLFFPWIHRITSTSLETFKATKLGGHKSESSSKYG